MTKHSASPDKRLNDFRSHITKNHRTSRKRGHSKTHASNRKNQTATASTLHPTVRPCDHVCQHCGRSLSEPAASSLVEDEAVQQVRNLRSELDRLPGWSAGLLPTTTATTSGLNSEAREDPPDGSPVLAVNLSDRRFLFSPQRVFDPFKTPR